MNRYHQSAVITSALLAVGCQTAVVRVQPIKPSPMPTDRVSRLEANLRVP